MINLQGVKTDVQPARGSVDRASLRVGNTVGFADRDGREVFGTVIKLNPKRAKVTTDATTWAVPYEMIFPVIDGETAGDLLLPDRG